MDAPLLPSTFVGSDLQEEIAAIHPACECDAGSRALMEYAG
jgi:hypothetical protein